MERKMGSTLEKYIMIIKFADNIVSPLGFTSKENFEAILSGHTELKEHGKVFNCHEDFYGSLFNRKSLNYLIKREISYIHDVTFFEKICIFSAHSAIRECKIDPSSKDVIFVLSTTKGNVEKLSENLDISSAYLANSAKVISKYFNNPNQPVVVSNACISGVSAQIAGIRLLLTGKYKYAVIIGCDVLSQFIISGFQSFKALSENQCKPFDRERMGLNLGEAAGTIILVRDENLKKGDWFYIASSNHNDANHISGPSRTGEGSFRVLQDIKESIEIEEIAFINVHGTSTAYNDEMESIAIERAQLTDVPINGLKGFYGHTLGAAGIIETIISMKAVDAGVVLATKGFENLGTSREVNISSQNRNTDKKAFIKLLSGFGGSNAGICYAKKM